MDKHLLDILCCPLTHVGLRMAKRPEIDALNRAIAQGDVATSAGTKVAGTIAEALITQDGATLYRVDDGIPVLLADEAIATRQLNGFPAV